MEEEPAEGEEGPPDEEEVSEEEAEGSGGAQTIFSKRLFETHQPAPEIEAQVRSLRGGGRSLSSADRSFFERRFGYNFSQVRVHTDAAASALAGALDARAFTVGSDIVFGAGQYTSHTADGRKLLAHELTHVVQQEGSLRTVPFFKKKSKKTRPKPKKKPKAQFVCGPNVTTPLRRTLSRVKSLFDGWFEDKKEVACNALIVPPMAAFSWDILDLHHNSWILQYRCARPGPSCPERPRRPVCATQNASPPCGSTVQVGRQCYYAGSANYVVFGLMCRLCHDHFTRKKKALDPGSYILGLLGGAGDLRESDAALLIYTYKVGGLAGANVVPAIAWAKAGYNLWPAGGTAPPGDRPNCLPVCPTPYRGSPFRIVWCPYSNPYAECKSTEAALESIIEAIIK